MERLDFAAEIAAAGGARELVKPPPVRDEAEALAEAGRVKAEKGRLRARHPQLASL